MTPTVTPTVTPTTLLTQAFELLVIEHLLSELCDSYSRRLKLFQPVVGQLLAAMAEGYEAGAMEGLHRLVPVKNGISNFEMVTSEVKGA